MNIQEFVKQKQGELKREMKKGKINTVPNWQIIFSQGGYYGIELDDFAAWQQTHKWCKENFGEEHYSWTGDTFWFETAEDAAWFALRWG